MIVLIRYCPTCKEQLSTGASQNGKPRFFCTSQNCPDRFYVITDPGTAEVKTTPEIRK